MDNLEVLNATWERQLDDPHAQLWRRMQAFGVTAQWVGPLGGSRERYREQFSSGRTSQEALTGYLFVIQLGSERVTQGTLEGVPPTEHVIGLLNRAANALERRGLGVWARNRDDGGAEGPT